MVSSAAEGRTVAHAVELNVLGDVLCKLNRVPAVPRHSHQQAIAQLERLVVICRRGTAAKPTLIFWR